MVAAPEKISIKRRRVDEPVDRLLYQSKKQRTSNHVFVRINLEASKPQGPSKETTAPSRNSDSKSTLIPGIPIVKSTQPGDEIKDFQRYRAAQNGRDDGANVNVTEVHLEPTNAAKSPTTARRFHLTRDLSTALRPQPSGGIRKIKSALRPHLPTFVERYETAKAYDPLFHAEVPIDRIIRSVKRGGHDIDPKEIIDNDSDVEKQSVQMFRRPRREAKTGRSIQDDPATWDLDSDELANELAALALDMDPDAKATYLSDPHYPQDEAISSARPEATEMGELDDFVYETYIRVQQNSVAELDVATKTKSFGYLVIDEEEEDLWEQYLREDDDEDEDWDEEDQDSNAEDNPRNEYPDEEFNSDDDHGTNAYKYRRNHSDDEQFDENDD